MDFSQSSLESEQLNTSLLSHKLTGQYEESDFPLMGSGVSDFRAGLAGVQPMRAESIMKVGTKSLWCICNYLIKAGGDYWFATGTWLGLPGTDYCDQEGLTG